MWKAKPVANGVELSYLSKDGDAGFPGNLSATVTYTLEKGDLRMEYSATTDKDTVLNLSNHAYFNLGQQSDILGNQVTLHASHFTLLDATQIPTGELKSVEGTPFDFRKPMTVGARINDNDPQLKIGNGYDNNWVIDGAGKLIEAAEIYEPTSGRVLRVVHRKFPGSISQRQGRQADGFPLGIVSGDATLSRLAESSEFSNHRIEARRALSHSYGV